MLQLVVLLIMQKSLRATVPPLSSVSMSHSNGVYADEILDGDGTPGVGDIGSAYSSMVKDFTTQCSEDVMLDEDNSDWLHSNFTCIPQLRPFKELQDVSTSDGGHGQRSFVEKKWIFWRKKKRQRDSSEQNRQRERERLTRWTYLIRIQVWNK